MTTFDDREQAYEKKFALDEELKFKALSRRNKMLGEWAGAKLGLSGDALANYVKTIRKADLLDKGGEDVFKKIKADFAAKAVSMSDADLSKRMSEFLAKAVIDIESEKK